MSQLGVLALEGEEHPIYLGNDPLNRTEYSQEIAQEIDAKIREIVWHCYEKAKNLIRENRPVIDYLVDLLIEKETIDGDTFRQILKDYGSLQVKAG